MQYSKDANQLSDIRCLFDGMKGHNYGLPDCIKFILERVGSHENVDFWDIAAITGDTVAQVYNHNLTNSCEYCVSGYLAGPEHIAYVFDVLGYSHEYVKSEQIIADKIKYQQKIVEYINKGVPVLVKSNLNDIPAWESDVGTYILIVGYENGGQTLNLLIHDTITIYYEINDGNKLDLIFIGEKQREVTLEEIYLQVIKKMPYWLTLPERDGMFFGAAAYRVWAEDIDAGRFNDESLAIWENYGVYVCNLATSGGEPTYIFRKLANMNDGYSELALVGEKIQKLLPAESPTGGRSLLWIQLEELGGGMNMGEVKTTMRDKEKRSKVAAALRDYAKRLDQALVFMLIPKDKFDVSGIETLKSIETKEAEPILGFLLSWIQDLNWPVAQELVKVLPRFHEGLIPHIKTVFCSNDAIWENWTLYMLKNFPVDTVKLISSEIKRIVDNPTLQEISEETNEYALDIIQQFKL